MQRSRAPRPAASDARPLAAVVPSLRADDDRDRLRAIARRFGWERSPLALWGEALHDCPAERARITLVD